MTAETRPNTTRPNTTPIRPLRRLALPWAALAAAGAVGLTAPAPVGADAPAKTDAVLTRSLAAHPRTGWADAIVRTGGPLTAPQEARLRALGADVTRHLPIIGSASVRVPARNLRALAALPFVTHLSSNGRVRKCDEFTVASSGAGAAFQQYGLTGKGVTVAVLDSGIQSSHQDISNPDGTSRIVAWQNFVSFPDTWHNVYSDYCGHGSHVAGIIAGSGADSTGAKCTHTYYGIARQAGLVSVRVLNDGGGSDVGTVVAGIQWAVTNRSKYKIRVINLSLGHPVGESYKTDPLCQAVEAAWKSGIVVVCAAGNSGRANATQTAGAANEGWGAAYGSIQSPANDPYVITVGATKSTDTNRAHDRVATYSSRGPSRLDLVCKPDILAPGNRVVSLDVDYSALNGAYGGTNLLPYSAYSSGTGTANQAGAGMSNAYFVLSGTSMAAPVVAGAAALLLQKDPTLSPDTVKARLMIAADKWADPQGNADLCTYGAGYLDIPNALKGTAVVPSGAYALSPQMARGSDGSLSLNTNSLVAANHVIWGSVSNLNVVWGSNVVSGSNVVWGSSVAQGSGVWADHVVWGTSTSAVDLSSVALKGE